LPLCGPFDLKICWWKIFKFLDVCLSYYPFPTGFRKIRFWVTRIWFVEVLGKEINFLEEESQRMEVMRPEGESSSCFLQTCNSVSLTLDVINAINYEDNAKKKSLNIAFLCRNPLQKLIHFQNSYSFVMPYVPITSHTFKLSFNKSYNH
jgi:hypothetical protein